MPYNVNIPGQVSEIQLQAIEAVASLIPENGIAVEIGSLFGRSSYAWSKSMPATASLYCMDPWEKNIGISQMEKRLGIQYSIDTFYDFTKDCENIIAKKGYSPQDFKDWDKTIDLYYEDAVHVDPILSHNLKFWTSHLKPNGIICGDDYRPRFPDVRHGAERLAEQFGRELLTVENFWCLLPPAAEGSRVYQVRTKIVALAERHRKEQMAKGVQSNLSIAEASADPDSGDVHIELIIELQGLLPWPETPALRPLKLEVQVLSDAEAKELLAETHITLDSLQLEPDMKTPVPITLRLDRLPARLWLEVAITDGDARLPLRRAKVTPEYNKRSIQERPAAPKLPSVNLLRSRELFLRHSRAPETFGLKPTQYSYYELQRPGMAPKTVRSMLSTHEIALLYALARDFYQNGAIVDLGPLLGASTWAFAHGLDEAGKIAPALIHSFDLWGTEGPYNAFLKEVPRGGGGSILGEWMQTVLPWSEVCAPHQGDFLKWHWDGREIGILFVDIAKSWALNDHIVSTMFPCLQPGSILVQQDYVHWNEYWIHIEMARFRPYFQHCQFLRGATSFYLCTETPPAALCRKPASELTYATQVDLLEEERGRAPIPIREVMKVAAAKHAIENGDLDRARKLLNDVNTEPCTDNPLIEVSGIAKSNLAAALLFLSQAEERLSNNAL